MGIVLVAYVATIWNLADIGTKPLNGQDFYRLLMEVYLGKFHQGQTRLKGSVTK